MIGTDAEQIVFMFAETELIFIAIKHVNVYNVANPTSNNELLKSEINIFELCVINDDGFEDKIKSSQNKLIITNIFTKELKNKMDSLLSTVKSFISIIVISCVTLNPAIPSTPMKYSIDQRKDKLPQLDEYNG